MEISVKSRTTAQRRWLITITALVFAGCSVQVIVTAAMFLRGAHSAGEQWLHNDTAYSVERINAALLEDLGRSTSYIARDPAVQQAASTHTPLAGLVIAQRWIDRDPDDHFVLVSDGAVVASDLPCAAGLGAQSLRGHHRGILSCGGAPYLVVTAPVGGVDAALWGLRALGERYVDRVADVTLCEVEIASPSGIVTSMRAVDGSRLPVAIAHSATEVMTSKLVTLERGYRGFSIGTISPHGWPESGTRSMTMLINTRPFGSDTTLAAMVPLSLLTHDLGSGIVALVVIASFMIALLAFAATVLIRRYTRPLQNLEEAARKISGGNLGARVVVEGDREVAGLAHSFNSMVEQLTASRTQLLQQEKMAAIGQLAAGVAHEINTPVQYAGDNTQFVERGFRNVMKAARALAAHVGDASLAAQIAADHKLDYYEREVPEAIAGAEEGLRRVATIVTAMRDFSHPSKSQKKPVSLANLIDSTATISRNEWKYVADLDVDVDPALPDVPALRDELSQVLLNIIVNASQAIGCANQGTGRRGHIHITAARCGEDAEIRVADDGPGISAEIQKRIFEPFFTTKPVGKGTGQGLAIAYAVVVEKHSGTIAVESAPNAGACFVIKLPIAAAELPHAA